MLAFILVLYCCILWKASYIVRNKRWPRATLKEKKRENGQRPKKRKKKYNKAKGLSKEEKRKKAQSA